jgi:hypothetical protein
MSIVAASVACLGLGGCVGSARTVQQGKDLCGASIQYTEALDTLLNVTIETVIDYDSDELIRQRKYADPNDLRRFLDERNEALIEQVKTLETFRGHSRRLQAYFVGLQELVDAKLQESAAAAVGDLSESIAAANESLSQSQKLDLNEQERASLSQLGGLVAKGVHAEVVRKVLRRDAAVIAEQLMLHEKLLEKLREILEDRCAGQMDVIGNQKIRKPYVAAAEPLGDEWKADRKQWIRSSFCLEELTKAVEAIRQMRFVWAGILEGRRNIESVQLALNDIHAFTQAVHALHEAGKEQED